MMDFASIAAIILSLGIGGLVGAIAAAALSATRLKEAFDSFQASFRAYFASRNDAESARLVEKFERLSTEVAGAQTAIERLKRALKRRK